MASDDGSRQRARFAVHIHEVSAGAFIFREIGGLSYGRAARLVERAARRGLKRHLPEPRFTSIVRKPRQALVARCLTAAADARRAGNFAAAAGWVGHARRWRTNYENEVREAHVFERSTPSLRIGTTDFPTYSRGIWCARGGDFPLAYIAAAMVMEA